MTSSVVSLFRVRIIRAMFSIFIFFQFVSCSPRTVFLPLFVHNKAHVLPFFMAYLQRQDFTQIDVKMRVTIDHCTDNSAIVMRQLIAEAPDWFDVYVVDWGDSTAGLDSYSVQCPVSTQCHAGKVFEDEYSSCHWSDSRFAHIIQLRQAALDYARENEFDYIWFLDVDTILTNPGTLWRLIALERPIIAPMLYTSTRYSNYWCAINSDGYYQYHEDYDAILNYDRVGTFPVPMVHSAHLIHLRHPAAGRLSYATPPAGYTGPFDDIIIFAHSAKAVGMQMYVTNVEWFGYMPEPCSWPEDLQIEKDRFDSLRLQALLWDRPIDAPSALLPPVHFDNSVFDKVFVINLLRRPAKRRRILKSLEVLNFEATVVDAVDGTLLNQSYLDAEDIHQLRGYEDPFHKRPLKFGEIGCFLSHFKIWNEMIVSGYTWVLILEDDASFETSFRTKLFEVMVEANRIRTDWDLIRAEKRGGPLFFSYLGRKALNPDKERFLSDHLVDPDYSYWTVGYVLSLAGARKLVGQHPLSKMMAVDEYIPLMYDRHPRGVFSRRDWADHFWPRNLVAMSAHPLLIHPSHYTGADGYSSDTEDSAIFSGSSSSSSSSPPDSNVGSANAAAAYSRVEL